MPLYSPGNTPFDNLEVLADNPYPGRLLVVGFSGEVAIQGYAIMGRSEGSRNRIFVEQDGIVSTEIFDEEIPVGDPALTIYDAMRSFSDVHVVSNGSQTNVVGQYLGSGQTFEDAMRSKDVKFEPDAPNYTPRITAFVCDDAEEGEPYFGISVISRNAKTGKPLRSLYTDLSPEIDLHGDGPVAYAVHTYLGDGNPLPSFNEPPFALPVREKADEMAELLWENLDHNNRVAAAVKAFPLGEKPTVSIINGHELQSGL